MVKRGAFFKPETPTIDMQYPAYFDPEGKNPKWDPTQKSHQEWHDLVVGEMDNTCANAGIVHDVYSKISIQGPKATEFLDRILTCAVPKKPGNAKLGYVCAANGTLMNECTVTTRAENDFYYCGQLGHGQYEMDLLLPLREELGYSADEVSIINDSQHYELLHVPGPKSEDVLREVMGNEAVDTPLFKMKNLVIDGIPMEVVRMSFTGMPGWEFHVPSEHSATVYNKIIDHPASKAAGLKPYGLLAVAGMRMDMHYRTSADVKGYAHYAEMSIDQFTSPKKKAREGFHGCDNSFEPKQEMVCLDIDTQPGYEWTLTFSPGSPILNAAGDKIGHTTSAAYGNRSKRTGAWALMYGRNLDGEVAFCEAEGQKMAAKVLRTPLVDFNQCHAN
jgi:glycine cleavage system aminomethyltransferase T